MKQGIHPKYYTDAKVTCTCGNTFTTGSTLPEIRVEICSNCHPFFTGEVKLLDLAGRVDKFTAKASQAKAAPKKKAAKPTANDSQEPMSLKEMLQSAKKSVKSSTN